MENQMTFKRYEIKYILTKEEKETILNAMAPHMEPDRYGRSTIRNIYYDTADFRLIRRSLERPAYKEKLRVRSYRPTGPDDPVFVELKKKYQSIVYKRRLTLSESTAAEAFRTGTPLPVNSQIGNEIEYFRSFYQPLEPKVFLSYDREAFFSKEGNDFRVTFDENILFREDHLSLSADIYGIPLLERRNVLMEIKTSGAIPLWMVHVLSDRKIYKTSFSKYGTAYQDIYLKNAKGGLLYA